MQEAPSDAAVAFCSSSSTPIAFPLPGPSRHCHRGRNVPRAQALGANLWSITTTCSQLFCSHFLALAPSYTRPNPLLLDYSPYRLFAPIVAPLDFRSVTFVVAAT